MICRRAFAAGDLKLMTPIYFDGKDGTRLEAMKPNVTILFNGRVEVCGGLGMLLKGTAEGWIVIDQKPHKESVLAAREQMDEWMRDYDLHRVQAVVREDFEAGARFLVDRMGMEYEGTLRCFYSPTISALLYARVR